MTRAIHEPQLRLQSLKYIWALSPQPQRAVFGVIRALRRDTSVLVDELIVELIDLTARERIELWELKALANLMGADGWNDQMLRGVLDENVSVFDLAQRLGLPEPLVA